MAPFFSLIKNFIGIGVEKPSIVIYIIHVMKEFVFIIFLVVIDRSIYNMKLSYNKLLYMFTKSIKYKNNINSLKSEIELIAWQKSKSYIYI